MNEYLIDRETLGQFVDELIKRKPLPVNSAEELPTYRESLIKKLDDQICEAIVNGLNEEQVDKLTTLLKRNEPDPNVFKDFFENSNLDLEKVIADTIISFSKSYVGGQDE